MKEKQKKDKSKYCPHCQLTLFIEIEDCMFCGGGQYYYCNGCGRSFERGKRGKVGEEL
jgi:transposase-like protein